MTKGIEWTSEMIFELQRLLDLEENLSFKVIAARMSEKFGVHFTRNSTVGKAHRMKLPPRPPREYATPERGDRMVTLRPRPQRTATRCKGKIRLIDLRNGECKWPSGTGPYSFCGKPSAGDGAPYCARHSGLAYAKPDKRWA